MNLQMIMLVNVLSNFTVLVSSQTGYLDIWEPALLTIKKEGYNIKSSRPGGFVVNLKFTAAMMV